MQNDTAVCFTPIEDSAARESQHIGQAEAGGEAFRRITRRVQNKVRIQNFD